MEGLFITTIDCWYEVGRGRWGGGVITKSVSSLNMLLKYYRQNMLEEQSKVYVDEIRKYFGYHV